MAKDSKFNIKLQIDGKEQISVASANTKEFAKQLGSAYGSMDKLSRRTFTFNQFAESARNAAEV